KIVEHLDLATICNLRLSSKALSGQCLGPHFRSFFDRKKADLTQDSLEPLRQLAAHPGLGSAVRDVTVLATVYDMSVLDRMLSTKIRLVIECKGAFVTSSEHYCSEEDLSQARSDLALLRAQREQQEIVEANGSVTRLLSSTLQTFGSLRTIDLDVVVVQG